MVAGRPWTLLMAVVVCVLQVQAQRVASGGTDLARPRTVNADATAQLGSAAFIAEPVLTAPSEIITSPRPLLVYIPFHVSEPASHITDMMECTFALHPWRDRATYEFDVLLAISGRAPAGNEQYLKRVLEDATASIVPRPRVFVEFKPLRSDRYVQDIAEDQKDADWVGGPNTAFYDALLDGYIYHKYVQHYKFVQQLETDVCALRAGWLDDLVAPLSNPNVLISGAKIMGDCVYIRAHDRCEANQDAHMRRHVNGNALYRVGEELKSVLSQARAASGNSEPFDLAIYWATQAMAVEHVLHSNPRYANLASLVDTARLRDATYYGGNITMVHVPRRLRSCMLRAAATRGYMGLPLTVIVVDGEPRPSLNRLMQSLTLHQIDRHVVLATSKSAFVQLSKMYPLRVLPAYLNDADARVSLSAKADKSGPALTATPVTTTMLDATPKALVSRTTLACEPWMRDGASPTSLLYTLIARLIRMGYAPLVVDQRALIVADYELAVFQMPADGVYVSSRDAKELGTRSNLSGWRPGLAYFPRTEMVASTADSLATMVDSNQGPLPPLPLKMLPLLEFAGPFDDLSCPLVARRKQLMWLPEAVPAGFDELLPRSPPHKHVACVNYTLAGARSVDVQADVAETIKQVISAVAMARTHAVSCVVLPTLTFKRRSAASMFKLVDSSFFTKLAGDVRLVPSITNIDTDRTPFVDVAAHQRSHIERSVCGGTDNACLSSAVRAVLAAADKELGRDFVCVRTTGLDRSDNAFVLKRRVDAVMRQISTQTKGRKVFLRGTWRHLPVQTFASPLITTLAHVRATLRAPPSPYTAQPFGTGDSVVLDEAWADAIESIVCAGAATSVTVRIDSGSPAPTDPAFLAGTPHTASDLAHFRAWLRRPNRPSLRGPVLVLSAAASCVEWVRSARLGLVLAHATHARHVVLPVVDPAWHINTTAVHAAFPSLLPPTVARLLLPRLTFDALHDGDTVTVDADASLGNTYAPELAFIERTRRATTARTVLWTANATENLHRALRVGLREWDWVVVQNAAANSMATEHALRAAVTSGTGKGSTDGFEYLRRVEAVFGTACGVVG